jgi:hypothetical protein
MEPSVGHIRTRSTVALLATTFALVACEQSPVAPIAGPDGVGMARVEAASGSYAISFLKEVSTGPLAPAADAEPVGTYLVLKSEVRDAAGNLAQSGSVKYEYCVSKGDYAPSAVCDSGAGSWRRLLSMNIDPVGQLAGFGACTTPRTIGFRFTFSGRSSGIASGTSPSRDFTWVAAG